MPELTQMSGQYFLIMGNGALTNVNFPKLTTLLKVDVVNNPSLTAIDFSQLSSVDNFNINSNAKLAGVNLTRLVNATNFFLVLTCNVCTKPSCATSLGSCFSPPSPSSPPPSPPSSPPPQSRSPFSLIYGLLLFFFCG
mmetsp:Transcript_10201/g.27989  ORF Transcript_10201/g.27989 Transcript_10201/m.27989 type:complete len:138 (-) Transcript_10201:545-958(-)